MAQNFMLFSELQKKVSPSPIKTWRLLDRMRGEGRMKEGEDFSMIDRKLYVNVPRFVVEMEAMGYAVKSDDIKNGNAISDDFKKLYDELRLISDEIANSRIQEEMKSDDIIHKQKRGPVISDESRNPPPTADMKSSEIAREESIRKSDGISSTVISPEINLKSPEFNMLLRSKDEIIESKKEQIEHMKEMYTEILKSKDTMLKSKDDELKEVRTALDTVVKQNDTLVHQNVFLTRLLTGPKEDRGPKHDDVHSPDFRDITDSSSEKEERIRESEPVASSADENSAERDDVPRDPPTTFDAQSSETPSMPKDLAPDDPVMQV
jgi:hypothetical protein